jgi:hypothetical protein
MKLFMLTLLTAVFSTSSLSSQYIYKSIEYHVSPDLSLNEAKNNSEQQVRREVISEIGVLIDSELKVHKSNSKTEVVHNYSEISTGSVKTKILSQHFDGSTLTTEYEIIVNKTEVLEALDEKNKTNKLSTALEVAISKTAKQNMKIENLEGENSSLKRDLKALKVQIAFFEGRVIQDGKYLDQLTSIQDKSKQLKESVEKRIKQTNKKKKNDISIKSDKIKLIEDTYIKGMTRLELDNLIASKNAKDTLENHFQCKHGVMNSIQIPSNLYVLVELESSVKTYLFYGLIENKESLEIYSLEYFYFEREGNHSLLPDSFGIENCKIIDLTFSRDSLLRAQENPSANEKKYIELRHKK